MSKQMNVDEEFKKFVERFGNDLEKELGFKPSNPKITKTIAHIFNGNEIKIKNGKRRPKKREWEFTVAIQ